MGWDWDVGQWFTPPKSKSPWQAMTKGSTGGWAKGLEGWGPALNIAMGAIPGVGPFLSALGGAGGMYGGGTGFQGSDKGWGNLGPTLLGGALGYGGGLLGQSVGAGLQAMSSPSAMVGQAGQSGWQSIMGQGSQFGMPATGLDAFAGGFGATGLGAGVKSAMGSVNKMLPGAGTQTGVGAQAGGSSGATGAWGANPLTSGGANTAVNAGAAGGNFGVQMLNYLKQPQNLLGVGSMIGSAVPQTPEYEAPSFVGDLTSRMLGGKAVSEIGQRARGELTDVMGREGVWGEQMPDEYFTTATRRVDESYDQAEKDLVKRYKHYGAEGSSDFTNDLRELRQDQAREKAALGTELEARWYTQALTRSYDSIKQALNVDDTVMNDLLGLAGMQIQEAAFKYGAEVADVQSLREALGLTGAALLQGASNERTSNSMLGV